VKIPASKVVLIKSEILLLLFGIFHWQASQAQGLGITTQGASGGLVIPSAEVLSLGTMALTYGSYQEPQLGVYASQRNMSFGIGVIPHVEIFGRFADYTNPVYGSSISSGLRDLSGNAKLQLPLPWSEIPKIAIGKNDLAGGAVLFRSQYIVASERYDALNLSLGYAQGQSQNALSTRPAFNGLFYGATWHLKDSGVSLLAEHDGQQNHAGVRWTLPPLESLGNIQVVSSLHKSFGAITPAGLSANALDFSLTLRIPLGENDARWSSFKPNTTQVLPPVEHFAIPVETKYLAENQLATLRNELKDAGLERVRVGMSSTSLVVEYENHRYGQNEADALGIVLGLSSEISPSVAQKIHAVALKEGLPLYETSVDINSYRNFLRDGDTSTVQKNLHWQHLAENKNSNTIWLNSEPSYKSPLRIEVKPDLNYTLGTEVGAFDYALASNIQGIAPVWQGGRIYTSFILPLAHSPNMNAGNIFENLRQPTGLKSAALQQSFWLGNHILGSFAAGRFNYDSLGLQTEATVFMPWSDDILRFRETRYSTPPTGIAGQSDAIAVTYRNMLTPNMWLEGGVQRYSDGNKGPSVGWTNWFGDVGIQLFYLKGGNHQFAGMQLTLPLTPRQGMSPNTAFLTGEGHYSQGIRTQMTTKQNPANLLQPATVQSIQLDTSLDTQWLNAGRLSQAYFIGQLHRMRESFYTYARRDILEVTHVTKSD
jgi:hypothetical protein